MIQFFFYFDDVTFTKVAERSARYNKWTVMADGWCFASRSTIYNLKYSTSFRRYVR